MTAGRLVYASPEFVGCRHAGAAGTLSSAVTGRAAARAPGHWRPAAARPVGPRPADRRPRERHSSRRPGSPRRRRAVAHGAAATRRPSGRMAGPPRCGLRRRRRGVPGMRLAARTAAELERPTVGPRGSRGVALDALVLGGLGNRGTDASLVWAIARRPGRGGEWLADHGITAGSVEQAFPGAGWAFRPSDASTIGERLVRRLHAATNAHDIEAFVGCFAEDYDSTQPAHPDRAFRGRDQVHANSSAVFTGVPTSTPSSSASTPSATRRGRSGAGKDADRWRAPRHGGRDRARHTR